ncbi:MAG: IMP dehydrogenase [Deltaproteobacteria bacterium]|nr:IMP dehydrogenase [Deltaproteobacteria bacterium]
MKPPILTEALTFDDVLLVPNYSEILPSQCDVRTKLTPSISLNIPLLSAAMDTVTEAQTAITMAREGGMGVIHKNLSVAAQAKEVIKVKKAESGVVVDPVTVTPEQPLSEALELMQRHNISGLPVISDNKAVGIITNRDVRFERNLSQPVGKVMTTKLVTASEGISREKCKEVLHEHRIEKLLLVDDHGCLKGLVTIKDIQKAERYPLAVKDDLGRLRVAAAVGVGADLPQRAAALAESGTDLLVVDTAHGHSGRVGEAVQFLKTHHSQIPVLAGNVATAEGFRFLVEAGADAVKVGVGPGSICTTRIVAGVGVPQLTAVIDCAAVAKETGVTLVADGGIRYSGDVVKALAAGAGTVMVGSLFAGTDEAPGEVILYQGRTYKVYRGMGSIGAMRSGSKDRYGQDGVEEKKLVPEGIEGRVPYRGALGQSVHQLVGGLKAGMGYLGARNLDTFRKTARFVRLSPQGLRESHVHDVMITKEAPNYAL